MVFITIILALVLFCVLFRKYISVSSLTMSAMTQYAFMAVSLTVVFISICIIISLLGPTIEFFKKVPVTNFLFSLKWSPFATNPSFGIAPLVLGTLLIVVVSILIAVPIATLSAIFVTQFSGKIFGGFLKKIFEIPASIPSIVYGYFGVLKVAPVVIATASFFGLEASYENAITAGITIAIMIAPIIFYITCDLIESVPKSLQYAVLAMGTTRTEFIFGAIMPYISSGILGAIFLAVARVIGETMIVVLVVGVSANLTINPLRDVTTVTAQIVSLLNSDTNAQSPQILVVYALGLALFFITLILSMGAIYLDTQARKRHKLLYS